MTTPLIKPALLILLTGCLLLSACTASPNLTVPIVEPTAQHTVVVTQPAAPLMEAKVTAAKAVVPGTSMPVITPDPVINESNPLTVPADIINQLQRLHLVDVERMRKPGWFLFYSTYEPTIADVKPYYSLIHVTDDQFRCNEHIEFRGYSDGQYVLSSMSRNGDRAVSFYGEKGERPYVWDEVEPDCQIATDDWSRIGHSTFFTDTRMELKFAQEVRFPKYGNAFGVPSHTGWFGEYEGAPVLIWRWELTGGVGSNSKAVERSRFEQAIKLEDGRRLYEKRLVLYKDGSKDEDFSFDHMEYFEDVPPKFVALLKDWFDTYDSLLAK